MIAVLAPLVNSYKRLVPGYEAPVYIGWARINRSALIRIPQISKGQLNSVRIELRCPDPSSNPYLAFAAMLAAGMDGVDRKLTPPEPVEENLYHFDAAKLESPPDPAAARHAARGAGRALARRGHRATRWATTSSSASWRPRPRSGTSTGCRSAGGRSTATWRRSNTPSGLAMGPAGERRASVRRYEGRAVACSDRANIGSPTAVRMGQTHQRGHPILMRRLPLIVVAALLLGLWTPAALAAPIAPEPEAANQTAALSSGQLNITQVVSGLSSPIGVVNAGDGTNRLFVIEQRGTVRVVNSTAPWRRASSWTSGTVRRASRPAANGACSAWPSTRPSRRTASSSSSTPAAAATSSSPR